MTVEIPKQYEPLATQERIGQRWLEAKAFAAVPDDREERFVVMMPLPNVTGALHMGHAMDNVMQDLLARWHRMRGRNTLWMPGTDHAGIATQAVVEKRLLELEGKTRHDIGREGLVERIWEWKETYQARIVKQQQAMGCSCDWDRQRFTMDDVCARAVREAFFRMFRDGLIYRGNRLVNWDCHLKTAVADDEVYHERVQGHFWHLRYPVIEPGAGEPDHVTVATTRPETMLGDTAVACHPEPARALEQLEERAREKLAEASAKERPEVEAELARLEERKRTHLPRLEQLAAMARDGRKIRLPLQERKIPLILDEWAKPELGSGCVKVTPAHDPNDYEVWLRHREAIGIVNLLEPDGTYGKAAGKYAGLDRFEVRKQVVSDLEAAGLLDRIEDREIEIGHSDRSKTPVEPYLSKQWFVRMSDVEGGVVMGRGTAKEFTTPGLAQAAMDAVRGSWQSATGRKLTFHPDATRYGNTYWNWLSEKRDWCISRQLWWGHRIPIWSGSFDAAGLLGALADIPKLGKGDFDGWVLGPGEERLSVCDAKKRAQDGDEGPWELQVCPRSPDAADEEIGALETAGLARDPDVLDTWFSSALWPHSTLGWPDPETAGVDEGQPRLGAAGGHPNALDYYYPGSCLVTARDIITLWVARMVIFGLYDLGDLPFTDVFIHATILDGKGVRMSKSKGNGIDPVDIIESYGADAMRYVLCDMQTGMQDIRLPVQAKSPYTGELVDLATAKHGRSIFTYICPESKKEFDVLGTIPELPSAKIISNRFEVGRNFCNKLWNATRFALMNLEGVEFRPLGPDDLQPEDRWILSRLDRTIAGVTDQLAAYNPSAAIGLLREFFWGEFCDWYLEMIKPRMRDEVEAKIAGQVLAFGLDQTLRLLHPFVPFVTEALYEKLNELVPTRGIAEPLEGTELLIHAPWPATWPDRRDETLDTSFAELQELLRALRDLRAKYNVPPSKRLTASFKLPAARLAALESLRPHITHLGNLDALDLGQDLARPQHAATQIVSDVEIYLEGVVDPEAERARLQKQIDQLDKAINGSRAKLSNENFTSRAPANVVEAERTRLADLEEQSTRLKQNLSDL